MITFKVMYQETKDQVPTRENTKALYLQATNLVDARAKLASKQPYSDYNIEFIQELTPAHLAYEQESVTDFHLEDL